MAGRPRRKEQEEKTAKSRYELLAAHGRRQFVTRAQHNALLTLPALFPLDGHTQDNHLIEPYSSLGGAGVEYLSSRLTTSMMPSGRPFLRMAIPPKARLERFSGGVDGQTTKNLAMIEQMVTFEAEMLNWRNSIQDSMLQLVVAGNVMEEELEDGGVRSIPLSQYVVKRDYQGFMVDMVLHEMLSPLTLPASAPLPKECKSDDDSVNLYTRVTKVKNKYVRSQWVEDAQYNEDSFPLDGLPYRAMRFNVIPGEDYGRARVSTIAPDLRIMEAVEKGLTDTAAMAARNFIMVHPGGLSARIKRQVVKAINGDTVIGDPKGVELKSFTNAAGFQLLIAYATEVTKRISQHFLQTYPAQRHAERVTAAEIERDIQELEAGLGGVFGALSSDIMQWRTRNLIRRMQEKNRLPKWDKETVEPIILTGLEALSRERDVGKVIQAGQMLSGFPPESADRVKDDLILGRGMTGLGFEDAIRDDEEVQQIRDKRAAREAASQGIGAAIPQAMKGPQQ